jgi:hypothetical protein
LRRRVIFHRVGGRNVLDQGAPWDDQSRTCRAVFLGRDFDGDGLLARLRACAAQPAIGAGGTQSAASAPAA